MNISINDELPGVDRKRILELYPIVYALKKFNGYLENASKFLGISRRALYEIMNSHDELRSLIKIKEKRHYEKELEKINLGDFLEVEDDSDSDPANKLYRYHLSRSTRSFDYSQMSAKERIELIERIRKLYY